MTVDQHARDLCRNFIGSAADVPRLPPYRCPNNPALWPKMFRCVGRFQFGNLLVLASQVMLHDEGINGWLEVELDTWASVNEAGSTDFRGHDASTGHY